MGSNYLKFKLKKVCRLISQSKDPGK